MVVVSDHNAKNRKALLRFLFTLGKNQAMIKFKVLKLFSFHKMTFFKFFLQIGYLRFSFANGKIIKTVAFSKIPRVSAKCFVSF